MNHRIKENMENVTWPALVIKAKSLIVKLRTGAVWFKYTNDANVMLFQS